MLKQQVSTSAASYVQTAADKRLLSAYPFSLNFYTDPPPYELTLNEFETYALARLKVLKTCETARIRSKDAKKIDEHIESVVSKELPLARNSQLKGGRVKAKEAYDQRRKDHISHFILRLAYCQTEDLRQWFIKQEVALFDYRFRIEESAEQEAFLRHIDLGLAPITPEEKQTLSIPLQQTHGITPEELKHQTFYRAPFEQVLDLVASRRVLLRNGYAYVSQKDQPTLVSNAFRHKLKESLELTAKALPRMDEDDRLTPILHSLSKQYVSKEYDPTKSAGEIRHDDVDSLESHFPPCMRNLHQHLRADAHLKYFGRVQFGLFLKGIGLPLEEALVYWRKAFHRLTDDEFQKKSYAYGVRYNYGVEGKRTNWTPYSCMKIITSNQPSAGDHHGCPFKHFSPDNLRDLVGRYGCGDSGASEVLRIAKAGHYQVACTRLFELTRGEVHKQANRIAAGGDAEGAGGGGGMVETIEHPNQFFDMSFKGQDSWAGRRRRDGGNAGSQGGPDQSTQASSMEVDR
ncbi:DNA primase large subunit [Rhizophlyctis rosea]|uniref:DNA primase large subunit n=1 Tax=Rhizophlyctis rosea TaxID=64517 RepID=A0AAD5X728_9FUNG|nr:DNA primase large subunit [Rhizophlyctis rosea]